MSISVLKLRYFQKTFYAEVEVFIEKPVKCFFGLDTNMSRKTVNDSCYKTLFKYIYHIPDTSK